ncbi:MAG: hypothetical protein U9Q81_18995 [Pseudomonadota bacterium]|nr:hypothetical protein [Pseudomonadota bacterium]
MKALLKALPFAAVLMTAGASVAVAAENFGDAPPKDVAADQVVMGFTCDDLDCAWLLRCTTAGNGFVVSVADEFLPGDVWRANAVRGNGSVILSTSNQDGLGNAFPPGIFSDPVTVSGGTVYITLNAANDIPAGFAAGFSLLVSSNPGITPSCQVFAASPSGADVL